MFLAVKSASSHRVVKVRSPLKGVIQELPRAKELATFAFTVDYIARDGYEYDPLLNNETSDTVAVP